MVKFIHKAYAIKHGRISAKQLHMEVSLHSHIGQHPNIIEWFATGEDSVWKWIAMEYAEGGDLFDKIEADVGVSEDIAHLYFRQLVSGVSYMHSKGVGHRDIKPENILLSETGDLKIADFGLATLFEYQGTTKLSTTMCGSPPYIAPEVITCSKTSQTRGGSKAPGYSPDLVDIWSCGVVLFVLLVGNTPWDEPTPQSWEFEDYCNNNGRSTDELWSRLPSTALSLLRGMLNVDPKKRFSFSHVKHHPWFTRRNRLLSQDGKMLNQLDVATEILESLRIDFNALPTQSQRQRPSQDTMDLDTTARNHMPTFSTQPETPINDVMFDWERPPRITAAAMSSSQPVHPHSGPLWTVNNGASHTTAPSLDPLLDEPSMSQFTPSVGVPLSLTQNARRFRDIVPNYSLTRFFSHLTLNLLLNTLSSALHMLNVPIPPTSLLEQQDRDSHEAWIKIKTIDGRQCGLSGDVVIDTYGDYDSGNGCSTMTLLEVRFIKTKGDPLEWRRFFKSVVVLGRDAVFVPGQ